MDSELEIDEILGRCTDWIPGTDGVRAYPSYDQRKTAIVIGLPQVQRLGIVEGSRAALARLKDGRYALVLSPCGWLVQRKERGAAYFFAGAFKCKERVNAKIESGYYVFPEGSLEEIPRKRIPV